MATCVTLGACSSPSSDDDEAGSRQGKQPSAAATEDGKPGPSGGEAGPGAPEPPDEVGDQGPGHDSGGPRASTPDAAEEPSRAPLRAGQPGEVSEATLPSGPEIMVRGVIASAEPGAITLAEPDAGYRVVRLIPSTEYRLGEGGPAMFADAEVGALVAVTGPTMGGEVVARVVILPDA